MSVASLRVGVLGAGSWGTALASVLARNGHATLLWGRDPGHVEQMRESRTNSRYLPNHRLPDALTPSSNLEEVVTRCDPILVVVPSHAFDEVVRAVASCPHPPAGVLWATKGFEHGSGRLLHETVAALCAYPVETAVLSGPTFAAEVAAGLPTAITIASASPSFARDAGALFHSERFRVYTADDVVGVEVGGAVKNVLAIAAGIADGLGLGANSRAALIARGLAELVRLGCALGGRQETFMGLTGLGDLVLTCTDNLSRNRRFGFALGQGQAVAHAQASLGQVVEGVAAAREVARLAERLQIEMPISMQVHAVVHQGTRPGDAVHELLSRRQKTED